MTADNQDARIEAAAQVLWSEKGYGPDWSDAAPSYRIQYLDLAKRALAAADRVAGKDPMFMVNDRETGLLGERLYQAVVQTTELRPIRIARTLGIFESRAEAESAIEAARRAK